jgi:hypothetical protein
LSIVDLPTTGVVTVVPFSEGQSLLSDLPDREPLVSATVREGTNSAIDDREKIDAGNERQILRSVTEVY